MHWRTESVVQVGRKPALVIGGLLTLAVSSWAQDRTPGFEAEFVASDIFRSGSLVARTWKDLHFDGQYFGTESVDAGVTAASWEFRWKELSISPGFGVAFGAGTETAPMLTLRWKLETRHWFSQGYAAQSLRRHVENEETGQTSYASVLDNNHISAKLGRLEIGGLWEHTKYREENEWKGGLRGAVRLGEHVKLIVQVCGRTGSCEAASHLKNDLYQLGLLPRASCRRLK